MKIKVGKFYAREDGDVEEIVRIATGHKEYLCSLSGNWYEKETGKYVFYRRSGHYTHAEPNWRDLVREVE